MSMPSEHMTKGRARMARPLTCSLLVISLCLAASGPSSAAGETLKTPTLTGTIPASPSTALRPTIEGDAEGVITSVLAATEPRRRPPGRVRHPSGGGKPGLEITIYAEDPTCSEASAIVAEGSATELDTGGIQVRSPT